MLGEAASLRWLAEAEASGGIRVAKVISAGHDHLVEERIETGHPTAAAARKIGEGLARTHAAGAPWWGCPPANWEGTAFQIQHSRTPVVPAGKPVATWGEFFAEYRIRSYLKVLRDRGDYSLSECALIDRVAGRVENGDFDTLQPKLVQAAVDDPATPVACARLHGDLWAGNMLWDADKNSPTGGMLIDPMAHGGHAETDLALLQLFGFPYLDEVLRGYQAASPLADGWQDRVGLHQLTPLLLHCVLFGGGYLAQTCT